MLSDALIHAGSDEKIRHGGQTPGGSLFVYLAQEANRSKAVGSALQALLVSHEVEFTRTHDIPKLSDLAAIVRPELRHSLRDAEILTPFSVEVRYPTDAPELLPGETENAFETARRARSAVRVLLEQYFSAD
jgi:HEPN domain-containing protein